jgi:hypothetical protein
MMSKARLNVVFLFFSRRRTPILVEDDFVQLSV